jgi:NAD(P)-dependent dehydrogenase (short-subunit alcohol dehydrogenase family)
MTGADLQGRVCLVTGATDGHGKAIALDLAARGADLILLARNREKALAVQDEIVKANVDGHAGLPGAKSPEIILADLGTGEEIDLAIESILASGRPLHLLVNNAGLVGLKRETNEAGHELTFAVNYLAMFRLTLGFLPRLKESAPARIVNISSDTYRVGRLHLDDLQLEEGYNLAKAYSQSKLAILYFTIELSRRLRNSKVVVNAVDPGPVASNIGANNPGLAYRLARPLIQKLFPSARRAARTALMVATDPDLAETSGQYFRSLKLRAKPLEFDAELSSRLWQQSLALCGIESDPLPLESQSSRG